MATDYVKIILDGFHCSEHEFGISMSYGKWVKVIFEDEETKTFRDFVSLVPDEWPNQHILKDLNKKGRDLQEFLCKWIYNIALSKFSFGKVCCKDVFVLKPRMRNTKGVRDLDDFRKKLVEQGLIEDKYELTVELKECGCT